MQCIITVKQPNQLTYCDETKQRALTRRPILFQKCICAIYIFYLQIALV